MLSATIASSGFMMPSFFRVRSGAQQHNALVSFRAKTPLPQKSIRIFYFSLKHVGAKFLLGKNWPFGSSNQRRSRWISRKLAEQKDDVIHGYRKKKYESLVGGRVSIEQGHVEFVG
jgi:hypothetical protein